MRNLELGDRVVIASTIGCGSCSYCRAGYYSQCETAILLERGTRRGIRAGADGLRYLSIHRRRGPLQIQSAASK